MFPMMFEDLAPVAQAPAKGTTQHAAPSPAATGASTPAAAAPPKPLPALPQALVADGQVLNDEALDGYLQNSLEALDNLTGGSANPNGDKVVVAAASKLAELVLKLKASRNRAGDLAGVDAEVLRAVQARALAKAATGGTATVLPIKAAPWVTAPGQVGAQREGQSPDKLVPTLRAAGYEVAEGAAAVKAGIAKAGGQGTGNG